MAYWVCPPWFECSCPYLGKLVSKRTMQRHRNIANNVRSEIGRGHFTWAPKVDATLERYEFACVDSLKDHPTDDEGQDPVPSQSFSHLNDTDAPAVLCRYHSVEDTTNSAERAGSNNTLPGSMDPAPTDLAEDDAPSLARVPSYEPLETDRNEVNTSHGSNRFNPSEGSRPGQIHAREELDPFVSATAVQEDDVTRNDDDFSDMVTLMDLTSADRHSCESETMEWIRNNKGCVDLYYNHGLTIATMDDILKLLRAPCKSWKTVRSNIMENTELCSTVQHYATCPGHMCFATRTGKAEVLECSVCGSEKPSSEAVDIETTVTYIPLVPRIRRMIEVEGKFDQLFSYVHSRTNSEMLLQDYFDGTGYANLCATYGGADKLRYDIFLAVSTDGFQAFKNNTCDVWPVVGILFNLPPHQRSSVKNVLPLMFTPNDIEPQDLQSFLVPLVNEIESTHTHGGILFRFPDGVERKVRIHLIWCTTDLSALVKVGGVNGVNGRFPCRFCWMEGYYVPESRHYYFVSWLHSDCDGHEQLNLYNPRALQLRSERDTEETYRRLEDARTLTQRKAIATGTGIKERSVLCDLPSMTPFVCFPPDIMHLMYNVQKELLQHHLSGTEDGFAVPQKEVRFLEDELLAFRSGISGQIAAKPKELSRFTSWKAADHKAFTLSYSLVIFHGYLSESCMNGLNYFVQLADICFRPSVSKREATEVKNLAVRFIENFENEYIRHDPKRAVFGKYVLHLLLHLGESLLQSGPLVCSSQYPMEGYIGWIVDRCNARYVPAKSMLISTFFGECYKSFYKIDFDKGDVGRLDYDADTFLGPKEDLSISELVNGEVWFQNLLSKYLKRKFPGINAQEAIRIFHAVKEVRLWYRYKFFCGSAVQVASVYSDESTRRASHYVAVEMDVTEVKADAYYGRLMYLAEFKLKCGANGPPHPSFREGIYKVAILQWAEGMTKGAQGQIYKMGSRENAFGSSSMEDTCIIQRLISVVEHAVPSNRSSHQIHSSHRTATRKQKRTYFLDDFLRVDYLLQPTRLSEDGINRTLKGLRRT